MSWLPSLLKSEKTVDSSLRHCTSDSILKHSRRSTTQLISSFRTINRSPIEAIKAFHHLEIRFKIRPCRIHPAIISSSINLIFKHNIRIWWKLRPPLHISNGVTNRWRRKDRPCSQLGTYRSTACMQVRWTLTMMDEKVVNTRHLRVSSKLTNRSNIIRLVIEVTLKCMKRSPSKPRSIQTWSTSKIKACRWQRCATRSSMGMQCTKVIRLGW